MRMLLICGGNGASALLQYYVLPSVTILLLVYG